MPTTAEYLAAMPNPLEQMKAGSDYVNSLYNRTKQVEDDQAQTQAGQAYGQGNYSGASTALANSGNIDAAAKVQAQGQANNSAGVQYIAKALPVLTKIAQVHAAEGPQAQAAALTAAFDHLAPEAKQLTGVSDQTLMALRQSFATDPQGTLQRLDAMVPTEFKTVGDTMFATQNGQVTGQYQGTKYITAPATSDVLQVGGTGSPSSPMPSGAATPAQAPAQSGTDLYGGSVSPAAVRQVESGGDPAAVSPAGATGTMQVMPGTAQDPGFGIQPAQSAADTPRVGEQYLAAMQQHFGNPVDALVAYNWGPGNAQKWIASGRHWEQLPRETRDYLGKVAIAQVSGAQPPPLPQQASQPQGGGTQVIRKGQPAFRPPTADEAKQYPGASFMTPEGPKYPPAATLAANVPDSAIDFSAQTYLRTGKLPTGTRNPTLAMRIVNRAAEMAKDQGMSVSDVIGAQQYRQSLSGALTQSVKIKSALQSYLGTFDKNLASLRSVIPAGAAQSVPIINRWIQAGRTSLQGDPDVTRLNVWIAAVRDEYAKILSGSTGSVTAITDAARNEADGLISNIQTPGQLYSALSAMEAESRNRLGATNATIAGLNNELRAKSPDKGGAPQQQPSARPQRQGAEPSAQDIVNELRRRGVVK